MCLQLLVAYYILYGQIKSHVAIRFQPHVIVEYIYIRACQYQLNMYSMHVLSVCSLIEQVD